jgi:glycosyltransferase involved in cell wall biosynthesis
MKSAPIVSVVIPAFNHGNYILDTLGSVFGQTFPDYEVIVVNDGSPDNTADVLQPLIDSGRIRYIEQMNAGQAAARNRGIAEASGKFIAYLDDDDLWPADKLEWQVAALLDNESTLVVYGNYEVIGAQPVKRGDDENRPPSEIYERLCSGNHIGPPSVALIRADALRAVSGFDETIKGADDWDLWLRLAEKGGFEYQNRLALHYRLHETNASNDPWYMYKNSMLVVRKHFGQSWAREHRAHYLLATSFVKEFVVKGYMKAMRTHSHDRRIIKATECLITAMFIDTPMVLRHFWRQVQSRLS